MKYGRMGAERGESCSNPGHDDYFTTPCCFSGFKGRRAECPNCGAPIACTVERQPVAVCTIPYEEDEE